MLSLAGELLSTIRLVKKPITKSRKNEKAKRREHPNIGHISAKPINSLVRRFAGRASSPP